MTGERRRRLDASLARLGRATTMVGVPEIFIEAELAIAVRRFGIWAVATRIAKQSYETWKFERKFNATS